MNKTLLARVSEGEDEENNKQTGDEWFPDGACYNVCTLYHHLAINNLQRMSIPTNPSYATVGNCAM